VNDKEMVKEKKTGQNKMCVPLECTLDGNDT
jgi:hypothetical protein